MSSSVRVVLRFRPLNNTEKEQGPESCVSFSGDEVAVVEKDSRSSHERSFTFDSVLDPSQGQEDVFKVVGIPIVDTVMRGYNGTVLAYGQTGSGKTHSMLGPEGGTVDVLTVSSAHHHNRGLIPRIVESLFEKLQSFPPAELTWKINVSVFELYRESILDLLTEGPQQEYRIREDTIHGRGVYVDNLFMKQCLSGPELLEAIRVGVSRRKVASTKSNETSSRSHSLTVITLEQMNHVQDDTVTVSRLNLVDLAGSEKVGKTQATGDRLKEAQTINLSLTLLGNVIYKLTDGKSGYIPYRNSKLTRILQDSFGGNSTTTLMCHCSIASYNREETISTMRFASRAKQIRNKPRVNRELSQKELQLAYAHALDKIRSLEEKIQIFGAHSQFTPSRVREDRSKECAGQNTGMVECNDSSHADLQDTITNLLLENEDLKKDMYREQEDLAVARQQIEFYKAKLSDAETALAESNSRIKRDEALFQRRLLDLQAENSRNQSELEALAQARDSNMIVFGEATAILEPTVACNDRDVGPRVIGGGGGGHIGNLRRLGDKEMEKRNIQVDGLVTRVDAEQKPCAEEKEIFVIESDEKVPRPPDSDIARTNSFRDRTSTSHKRGMGLESQSRAEECVNATGLLPPTSNNQRLDFSVQVQLGKTEAELLLEMDELQRQIKLLTTTSHTLRKQLSDRNTTIERMAEKVENLSSQNDDYLRELESLRQVLEAKERENGLMRRILQELNIDIEEKLALLGSEQERNAWLKAEADKLRQKAQTLQDSQEQQEYCDMANMELLVKTEDMDAVENELGFLSYSALTGGVVAEGTRLSCLETLRQLAGFLSRLLETVQGRVFNTSNLESQRLSVVSDAVRLQHRVESAQSLLSETSTWTHDSLPPRQAPSRNANNGDELVVNSARSGSAASSGPPLPCPAQPPLSQASKGVRRTPSVSALSASSFAVPKSTNANALRGNPRR